MTLEGQGAGGGDTPGPPARTRWSEDATDEDDVLLPPFIPGASRSAPPQDATGAPPEETPEPAADAESASRGRELADPWAGSADLADLEQEAASPTMEPEPTGPAANQDEFPFHAFDIEGGREEGLVDAALDAEVEPERGATAPSSASRSVFGGEAESEAEALAERLERLAGILRREGPVGIEREIVSRDRLTSLLAGVLAGYRARMEE